MIQKMTHATLYVLDQDRAKDFYVDKLGFELKADFTAPNGFRWLTVAPKGQSEVEIALLKIGSGGDFGRMGETLEKPPREILTRWPHC